MILRFLHSKTVVLRNIKSTKRFAIQRGYLSCQCYHPILSKRIIYIIVSNNSIHGLLYMFIASIVVEYPTLCPFLRSNVCRKRHRSSVRSSGYSSKPSRSFHSKSPYSRHTAASFLVIEVDCDKQAMASSNSSAVRAECNTI